MFDAHFEFEIDYTSLEVYDEFNIDHIQYPIVLSSPHSGTVFPKVWLENISLSVQELRDSEDVFVTELFMPASNAGIPMISANIHRTFIDLNRDKIEIDDTMYYNRPHQETSSNPRRCRVGLGLIHRTVAQHKKIYEKLLSSNEVEKRIEKIYEPYHKRLNYLVEKVRKKFGFCLLIDCHSMPDKICSIMSEDKKVDFCLGNLFDESSSPLISQKLKNTLEKYQWRVELNRPYAGAFITLNYCQPRKSIYTLHFEVNKSLYADEKTLIKNNDFQLISSNISSSIIRLGNFLLDFK
ncbi:MAG: N-formylglutamate amidohydrolase [Alphaproteobacteria bacterium]|nr:N-formylglutamate amidohydrolase [Alphaproteobacteria bacterium]